MTDAPFDAMADVGADSDNGCRDPRRRGQKDLPELQLARLATRQFGIASREQLLALGFTARQITWRVGTGRLCHIHHNVYAVGHSSLPDHAYLLAALLSKGPAAFLSHRSAAAAWGLRPVNRREIELTIPGGSRRSRRPLVLHRASRAVDSDDVRIRNHLRVSAVPLMLIQLAVRETPGELGRLISTAVGRRLLRLDLPAGLAQMEAALRRHPRHPGLAALKAALAAYRPTESHKSQLELAFDRVLGRHPEIPDPLRNIKLAGWEVDRFWPAPRLALELDGRPYHVAAREMERDRVKDVALQRAGCVVMRVTDFRFEHDLTGVLHDLGHFLGTRRAA